MKKLILLAAFVLACSANANDIRVILTDSISAADSVGAAPRADTVYSPVMSLQGSRYVQFFARIGVDRYSADTNWTADTFFVDFQTSADQETWITHEVDTFLANGSSYSPLNIDADAVVFGNYGRARFIHWDSLEATGTALFGNVYRKELQLWVILK